LRAFEGEAQRETIREWALAHGGFTPRELAAPPPEPVIGKYPCAVDHRLSWAPTDLKREGLLEKPKWGTWRLTSAGLSALRTEPAKPIGPERLAEPVEPARLAELRAMRYRDYLRTPEWRRTREAALSRAGNACSLDAGHTENMEVHHRSYERLGAELTTDLVVLCHACHQLHHKQNGRPRRERTISSAPLTAVALTAATSPPATDSMAAASADRPDTPSNPSLFLRLLRILTPAVTLRDTRP
jgi:hypothetical protein